MSPAGDRGTGDRAGIHKATALEQITGEGSRWQVFAKLGKVTARRTKTDKPYLDLVLQDTSRRAAARMWCNKGAEKEMLDAVTLPTGTVCKVQIRVDSYQDAEQLIVDKLRVANPDTDEQGGPETDDGMLRYVTSQFEDPVLTRLGLKPCRALVFDIETVPAVRRQELTDSVSEALARRAEQRDTEPQALMGMSPWFGKVVSLALGEGDDVAGSDDHDGDQATRAPGLDDVQVLACPKEGQTLEDCPEWCIPLDEKTMLEAFWALAAQAECVVTYNGFGFDVPFLVGRSLALGVDVKVDLLGNRWKLRPHLDLFDHVRGGGPSSLDVVCFGLGIESPKGAMDGSMVAPAYERGELLEIAHYNRHDVRATTELYRKLRDTVLPAKSDW